MSFQFVHDRRLAELEYELRLAEIDLAEHRETYLKPDRFALLEMLEAKMRLAHYRMEDYRITHCPMSSRIPSPLMTQSVLGQPFCSASPQ